MIAAIYARKSTEQHGVGDDAKSVTRQVEHARAYAKQKGWAVADEHVYVDDGISGADFERPELLRLMNALRPRPPFVVLIMSEESRLGREQIETPYVLKQIITAGVRVFSYLEDRELTLDSPTEKFLLSVTAFADEMERERARQRTRDALVRRARAGYVAGGAVYGYANVRTPSGVKREVNDAEAAVLRRIFEMYAGGLGFRGIAHRLNEEGVPAPRPSRCGPKGWSPSAIREMLYRDLYRGLVVWGKTKKRDRWGRKRRSERPLDDWVRIEAPELRIVSDELWTAAHDRLRGAREIYLRDTRGKLWGKPVNGVASKFLLTGMAVCACCGGALTVRHGKGRECVYMCLTHVTRGPRVCGNSLPAPMDVTDRAVLGLLEETVLRPEVVAAAVEEALARLRPSAQQQTAERERLTTALAQIEREIGNLTQAVALAGPVSALLAALTERQSRRDHLQHELIAFDQLAQMGVLDVACLELELRQKMEDWKALLTKHVQQARQILRTLLEGRLRFTPQGDERGRYYVFEGTGRLEPVLAGLTLPNAVVAPTGFGCQTCSPLSRSKGSQWCRERDSVARLVCHL